MNIQLPRDLKDQIEECARRSGESVSEFLRKSAAERVAGIRRAERDARLAEAYVAMGEENAADATAWQAVDLEGWE